MYPHVHTINFVKEVCWYVDVLREDNPLNLQLAQFMLNKAGYQLDVAKNGKEAVEKYTANPDKYNLIFMDINMPEMDGLEATKVLRNRGYKDIPIIAMTADVMQEDKDRCMDAGMNDFIAKPIRVDDLEKRLHAAAEKRPAQSRG